LRDVLEYCVLVVGLEGREELFLAVCIASFQQAIRKLKHVSKQFIPIPKPLLQDRTDHHRDLVLYEKVLLFQQILVVWHIILLVRFIQ